MKEIVQKLSRTTRIVLAALLLGTVGLAQSFAQEAKSLPYSYGFENNDLEGEGWTLQNAHASTKIAAGAAIHSPGSYGFQFYLQSTAQLLISPELDGTEGVSVSFWYRSYVTSSSTYTGQFNVGYSTTTTDAEAFTWVRQNPFTSSVNNWRQTGAFVFPEGTKYVAISCITNGYAFVDDITITTPVTKALPYEYGFETAEGDLPQNGWTIYANTSCYATGGAAPHEGENGYQFYGGSTSNPLYLISPELTGTANGARVTFYYGVYSGTQEFYVGYSTTTRDVDGTNVFTWGDKITATNATSASNKNFIQLDPTVFPAGTKFVAIKYVTSGYLFLDDFEFTDPPTCEMPDNIVAEGITTTSAELGWSGGSETYNVEYKKTSDEEWTVALSNTTEQYHSLQNLEPGTNYAARVQSVCADRNTLSDWKTTYFATECEAITLPYSYGFEDSESEKWTCWDKGTGISIATGSAIHDGAKGLQFFNASGQAFTSPEMEGTENGVALYFYYGVYSGTQTFQVGYYDGNDWIWTDDIEATNITYTQSPNYAGWLQYVKEDIPANVSQVAIKCTSSGYFFVDDIEITVAPDCLMPTNVTVSNIMPTSAVVDWEGSANMYDIMVNGTDIIQEVTHPYTLENLTVNTAYTVQVRSRCYPGYSEWTAAKSFTTLNKAFVGQGNWEDDNNWVPAGAPTVEENVDIMAAAFVNTIGYANTITLKGGGSITLRDGAQLKHGTSNLQVTVEKAIAAYPDANAKSGYYLIANPLNQNVVPTYVWNMIDDVNEYDLYRFDAAQDGLEWRNYKKEPFSLYVGRSYLYARAVESTLSFEGTTYNTNSTAALSMGYTYEESEATFNGWLLVGNPFICNGYISYADQNTNEPLEADFYVMNTAGNGFVLSESSVALAPCQGAFICVGESGNVLYNRQALDLSPSPKLDVALSQSQRGGSIDQVRVRFGNGSQMPKLSFREGSSMICIPQADKDYAVVRSNGEGELPLNFKAETNGTYTLSFSNENVEFSTLRLIDNLTGADIDLLATPSYSFEARTTDYASRFRLVFNANTADTESAFAYFNGSEWVVNASGNATVQVVDMMGRMVHSANGTSTISTTGLAQGVYVLRLVDGTNVKTQKIVVR